MNPSETDTDNSRLATQGKLTAVNENGGAWEAEINKGPFRVQEEQIGSILDMEWDNTKLHRFYLHLIFAHIFSIDNPIRCDLLKRNSIPLVSDDILRAYAKGNFF